jgi:hypothetical protein
VLVMLGFSTALGFLSGGGLPVTGGSITVPDEPYAEPDPVDPVDPGDPTPDPAPAVLPITVTSRWSPAFSTTTMDGTRIATATDLTGLAAVSAPLGAGPTAMTDALGRKFWRFESDGYLEIADALAMSTRNMSAFMVGRFHRVKTRSAVLSLGRNTNAAPNTVSAALETSLNTYSAPLLRAFAKPTNNSYPSPEKMVTGSQMQVVGMVEREPANGGSMLWMNNDRLAIPNPIRVSDVPGGEIGRFAYSPGNAGSWGMFDLYEMVIVDSAIPEADGDALAANLMTTYGVVPITNQLVLEGDSIMEGTGPVTSGLAASMVLTEPGADLLGPDWRVVNMAGSGSKIDKLMSRRDADHGWAQFILPGENVMAFELGRNDISTSGGQTPAQHYINVVGYLSDDFGTSATSILARGWDVRVMVNIASAASLEPNITTYRALLRNPGFAIDTQTDAGSVHASQMQLVDTDLITVGGNPVFATPADAADVTYYAGDSTHPNVAGCIARVTGGDTPARGIAFGL